MELYVPNKEEATALLAAPKEFCEWTICEDALPPPFILERGIAGIDGAWCMPRLFCDVVIRRVVGSGAFKSGPRDRRVEICYGIAPACRCRGYATEGVRLLVEEAFSSGLVNEVFAGVSASNTASMRVLAKAGFIPFNPGNSGEGQIEFRINKKT